MSRDEAVNNPELFRQTVEKFRVTWESCEDLVIRDAVGGSVSAKRCMTAVWAFTGAPDFDNFVAWVACFRDYIDVQLALMPMRKV